MHTIMEKHFSQEIQQQLFEGNRHVKHMQKVKKLKEKFKKLGAEKKEQDAE